MRRASILLTAACAVVFVCGVAGAASDPVKCTAAKMKSAAKHAACRLVADAEAATAGTPPTYAKCDTKQAEAFARTEGKYAAACPTTGDQASVQEDVTGLTTCVANGLTGAPGDCNLETAQLCGNGIVDPGEVCDQSALNGATCATAAGGVRNQGTLACGPQCVSFDTSGCITCPAADAAVVDGVCWIRGQAGDACTTACGAHGMAYDDRTRTYAGSDGTLASCGRVTAALGSVTWDAIANDGPPVGVGCFGVGTAVFRKKTVPTDAQSFAPSIRRICACS